jgi:hypothetical protein
MPKHKDKKETKKDKIILDPDMEASPTSRMDNDKSPMKTEKKNVKEGTMATGIFSQDLRKVNQSGLKFVKELQRKPSAQKMEDLIANYFGMDDEMLDTLGIMTEPENKKFYQREDPREFLLGRIMFDKRFHNDVAALQLAKALVKMGVKKAKEINYEFGYGGAGGVLGPVGGKPIGKELRVNEKDIERKIQRSATTDVMQITFGEQYDIAFNTKAIVKEWKQKIIEGRGRPSAGGDTGGDIEHIQVQLRKVINLRGAKPVEFQNGKKVTNIKPRDAEYALKKINDMRGANDKHKAVKYIFAKPENLAKFIKDKENY